MCVADTPVAVTVNDTVPVGVDADVTTDNVELCPELIDAGLNDADAPAGNPDTLNATFCATPTSPSSTPSSMPDCPAVTVTEDGAATIEKSFGGGGGVPRPSGRTRRRSTSTWRRGSCRRTTARSALREAGNR